jgi:hypothetical protein
MQMHPDFDVHDLDATEARSARRGAAFGERAGGVARGHWRHGRLLVGPGSDDRASTSRYPLVSALSPVMGPPLGAPNHHQPKLALNWADSRSAGSARMRRDAAGSMCARPCAAQARPRLYDPSERFGSEQGSQPSTSQQSRSATYLQHLGISCLCSRHRPHPRRLNTATLTRLMQWASNQLMQRQHNWPIRISWPRGR